MNFNSRNIAFVVVVLVVAALAFITLNTREHRTVGQKVDAAMGQLDNGVDNAARELKDRTPAERLKDDVKDATNTDK